MKSYILLESEEMDIFELLIFVRQIYNKNDLARMPT